MALYNNPDHEVIYCILELLPTVEEALHHMVTQIDELRLEGAEDLFKITAQAIYSISYAFVLQMTEQDDGDNLRYVIHIREAIRTMVDRFEVCNLLLLHQALVGLLLPAFNEWRQKVELILQPRIMS